MTVRPMKLAIRSRRVILPQNQEPQAATVLIEDERITSIAPYDLSLNSEVLDVGNRVVMPGIVDTHAHINEPGRTEWEGFQTATRAAAAGGITTVVDMPLNSIPATTSLAALKTKAQSAQGGCRIDYGFWGGVIPGNSSELLPMIEAGALGFKAFLIESGVDEFPMSREADLREAMRILAQARIPLLVHAELESAPHAYPGNQNRTYRNFLESRPREWEVQAIQMMIRLARETGCAVHIVHLSASDALQDIAEAKRQGVPITAETCPHYLALSAEEIPDGATQFKCAPPIREKENQERLWQGLKDSVIDFVVSDHSPCTPKLKALESGDFEKAWGGISGLQFSLPVVWTEMKRRGLTVARLSEWMSSRTARFAGLQSQKGTLAAGMDADLVIWDPEATFTLTPAMVHHRHTLTPYAGRQLHGVVEQTFVRGRKVFDAGSFPDAPVGHQLFRTQPKGKK